MNGVIFYAEERRRLLWIWDEDKGGDIWVLQILWVGWV
jgi:hypothetical protein